MDKELLRLLQAANRAIRDGVSRKDVERSIRQRTRAPGRQQGYSYAELGDLVGQMEVERPKSPITTGSLLLSMGQGAALEFIDELVGGFAARAATGGGMGAIDVNRYKEVRDAIREKDEEFLTDHLPLAIASRLLGAVGLGAAGMGVVGARAGAAAAPAAVGLLPRAATGAAYGAGFGAAAGAGAAEELEEVPIEALIGGGVGVPLGAGLSTAAYAAGALPAAGRMVRGRFAPAAAGRAAARRTIQTTLAESGLTTQEALNELARLEAIRPGQIVPADISPQFEALARATAGKGTGRDIVRMVARIRSRVEGGGERLMRDLQELTGFGQKSVHAAREAAEARLAQVGKDVFGELELAGAALEDVRLTNLTESADVAPIWRAVRPLKGKGDPSFIHYQQLRRRLGGAAAKAAQEGNGALAQDLYAAQERLTDLLEQHVGGFRAANRAYAQTAQTVKAFDMGSNAYKRNIGAEGVEREMAELAARAGNVESEAALNAYRHGMVDEMSQKLMGYRADAPVGRQVTGMSPRQEAGVRAMFESDAAFAEFVERAYVEEAFGQLRKLSIGDPIIAEQISELLRSGRTSVFWSKMAAALNWLAKPNPQVQQAQVNEILRTILAGGEAGAARFGAALRPTRFEQFMRAASPDIGFPAGVVPPSVTAMRRAGILGGPQQPQLERRQP